ncbi:MAG: anti-sigma factor [Acidobacteriota bacterium]
MNAQTDANASEHDVRLLHLLAERATEGLDLDAEDELADRLAGLPDDMADGPWDVDAFDEAAALCTLVAHAHDPAPEALGDDARARIESSVLARLARLQEDDVVPFTQDLAPIDRDAPPPLPGAPASGVFERPVDFPETRLPISTWSGWLAAAACLALAVAGWWPRIDGADGPAGMPPVRAEIDAPTSSVAARHASFVERAQSPEDAEVGLWMWVATEDPAAEGVTGDVVWSTQDQEGYMRFTGLPVNDPTVSQYQLWIFDRTQDERYPIDGGVFDVDESGEAIVPIQAKISVDEPFLFAVTVEPPGGVVVSSRDRIVLTAATT